MRITIQIITLNIRIQTSVIVEDERIVVVRSIRINTIAPEMCNDVLSGEDTNISMNLSKEWQI